jgi:asparagine synthase (glutamine-hydrolysing)
MCGFVGYTDLKNEREASRPLLAEMTKRLVHRGPDSDGYFVEGATGLGFRRLSIIDLVSGDQPIYNEDGSLVLLCNGEIYNYRELRNTLQQKGHVFSTNSDVEVLLHLYEDEGVDFLNKINGQFAFVIHDRKQKTLFLARDHFGIVPLFYAVTDGTFIFGSEIKALLQHPAIDREVDLTGLDQVFSFPGLVSPRTMFKGIESVPNGHYVLVKNGNVKITQYWDLDYPQAGDIVRDKPESYYVEKLKYLFAQSVKYRLQADVPVGFYLSGGLDSSMIASMIRNVSPGVTRHSFSIGFNQTDICEAKYQRMMAEYTDSAHHEIMFDWKEIAERLPRMIYHSECPVKETYNTCSMALSAAAKASGITVILTGEGADELFAGYVGYRFDQLGLRAEKKNDLESMLEDELREKLWGDATLFYETEHYAFRETRSALYSATLNDCFDEFDCLNFPLVNKERLQGRHFVHQRSYLDFKLRLADHLISDHGDRMALAHSVEGRYPFLDIDLVEFSKCIPPELKLNQFTEKYILRKVAEDLVPPEIVNREKYGFHAPGTPYLLRQNIEWINDLLSHERIKRQGYFNPDIIERLKAQYSKEDFRLNLPFESDLLMTVLSFGIFLDTFEMPGLN